MIGFINKSGDLTVF